MLAGEDDPAAKAEAKLGARGRAMPRKGMTGPASVLVVVVIAAAAIGVYPLGQRIAGWPVQSATGLRKVHAVEGGDW